MSQTPEPALSVRVDPTNPGQFFACCGLLELAERLWCGAEGWFEEKSFILRPLGDTAQTEWSLTGLLRAIAAAPMQPLDPDDDFASPIQIQAPFLLRLDWWKDDHADGKQFKVWAGSMRGYRIARAMQAVMLWEEVQTNRLFDYATVVYDPFEQDKKVEPFYFDARRGSSAQPIDIGFSPDSFHMTNLAYPAVEFLCAVGLQRFRPMPTGTQRLFEYCTWSTPLAARIAPLAVSGLLARSRAGRFRFEVAFRTDQRKHKAFMPATSLERS
jgi:hypothetical protein